MSHFTKSRSYSSQGIILSKRNFSESDKILTIFSKEQGKTGLIAKGIRKLKSRKRGHLEVFNYINFHATKGKDLDMITEVETVEDFKEVRSNLKKISLAYYFMEVISKITQDKEKNEAIFEHLLVYLKKLKTLKTLKKLRIEFVTKILVLLGYWPYGQELVDVDQKLEEVIERKVSSVRVGKILSSI